MPQKPNILRENDQSTDHDVHGPKSSPQKPTIGSKKPSSLGKSRSKDVQNDIGSTDPPAPKIEERKPSTGPRTSSTQRAQNSRPQPPQVDTSPSISKALSNRPSIGPTKSSSRIRGKGSQKEPVKTLNEVDEANPAHKLAEENRNLKDVLSESQCGDLTILVANITERMRKTIENAFNATSGLKLLSRGSKGKNGFADADFDPGTVDVSAYDKERKIQKEQEKELAKPQSQELKKDALNWFDEWRQGVIQRVGEVVNSKETASEQKEQVSGDANQETTPENQQRLQKIGTAGSTGEYAPPKLEDLFPRVRTPLTKLPMAQRVLVLHSVFLLLLSLEHYNAASRVLLLYLTSSLKVGLNSLREDEERTAQGLLEAAKQMTAEQERGKKKAESQESRKWKIRLASAAGAAIIGYTGGMAAPMVAAGLGTVMGELGLGATTAASYLGTVAGNTAIVGSLFGAYGGRMTGQIMSNISADVEDFAFLPVHGERKEHAETLDAATDTRRLRVVVTVSGWLLEKEEVVSPWRVLKPSAEVFALRFELEALMNLGQSFDTMLSSAAYGYAQSAVAKRTVFSELMSAMWPVALVKVARVVDNPFSLAKTRAEKAGEVLAEALMNRAQGERPVTLIGYSLGARVIWSCLTTLAKKRGFGFVESAVMIGSPIPSDTATWRSMRTVVSGRLINVYSENDYLLAFLYRSASLQYGVAGLMPVTGLSGIENVDVSEMVSGHLRYRYLVGSILEKLRFEDVDRDEVAKETKVFDAMVEEEKKNTYEKQLKENAGNLYDQYGERLGLPKQGRSFLPQKEKEVNDESANKEASKMENEIHQKTQKGLMQWAVEQLYISRPGAPSAEDVQNAASNPEESINKTGKDIKKTSDAATKSLYQRASEALYLTRSGGPEGEAAAKDKLSEAQSASPAKSGSYLSTAAGYIPTGYLPGFSSSPKASKTPKRPGETPKRPSTLLKSESKSRTSTSSTKKVGGSRTASSADIAKPGKYETKDAIKVAKDSSQKSQDAVETGKEVKEGAEDATEGASVHSHQLPSPGLSSSSQKKDDDEQTSASQTPKKTLEDDPFITKKHAQDNPQQDEGSDHKQAKGYESYIPSFGFGGSATPEAGGVPKPEDGLQKGEGTTESVDKGKGSTEQASSEPKPDQKSTGYGSYVPSFGFGGGSESKTNPAEDSAASGPGSDAKKEDSHDQPSPRKDADAQDKGKAKPTEIAPESIGSDTKQDVDEPSKKKYPWETVLEQGGGVDPGEQTSSYMSYVPSFGYGSTSGQQESGPTTSEAPDHEASEDAEPVEKPDESGGGSPKESG